jgi:uroporphyrinogen-III synthase
MRVLVLRPEGQAQASAARLDALGHHAVVAPILSIEATGAPAPPGLFAAAIITSGNALPALRSSHAIDLPVFAVGRRTGLAAAEAGFGKIASAADAVSLARLVIDRMAPARLLLIQGQDRKPEPEASLVQAGFEIAAWEVYRAVARGTLAEKGRAALADGRLDAVLHFSRRSAETAIALVRAAGLETNFAALRHLCLSNDVADGLKELAGETIEVASRPDEDALLALLSRESQARSCRNRNAKDGTISPACNCRTANG